MSIKIKITPLSRQACAYQFVWVGVETIGSPVIMEEKVCEYLIDHDNTFRELLWGGKTFYMSIEYSN